MSKTSSLVVCALLASASVLAQRTTPNPLAPYVSVSDPVVALTHVEVIDGTGAAPASDQTVVLDHGTIASIGASTGAQIPDGATILDLHGDTVYPGLVGMHEHLFYVEPGNAALNDTYGAPITETGPRLYLAAGITTARTTGSMAPYADLNARQAIEAGLEPGPDFDITGPYLEGEGSAIHQLHGLTGAADATRTVDYWAAEGVTSFKAYNYITPAELRAAIDAAHAHGLKITGHLCSIGFTDAADMGIDNLEHGLVADTEFYSGSQPGTCIDQGQSAAREMAETLDVTSAPVVAMIHDLVTRHVAVTSTLSVLESFVPNRPPMAFLLREKDSMTPRAWASVVETRAQIAEHADRSYWGALFKKEMQFERAFVAAGGLLMAGCDPTGYGATLPGFGDERNLELLVEAGFTPEQAIQIYTQNGATYLGRADRIGTLTAGKQADLVVVSGHAATDISAVEHVRMVFKKGVGYDPSALIDSVRGMVGIR